MINLYDSKETSFNHNGLVVLSDCITCNIAEELNGIFELDLEYPLDEQGKWQYLLEDNVIKADAQLFRVYRKIKTLNSVKINARAIYYDLLSNLLEDVRPTNLSGASALDYILDRTQYSHPFTNSSDVGGSNTIYFVRKNPIEAITEIINTYGGELKRDNFSIELLQARGLDRGVLVSYGKNIQGINETLDMDSLCTRLMPIGKDGLLLSEKYIDSPYINNYPHPIIKVVEFTDIETEAELRAVGQNYILDSKCDIPKFNYKIDFLELSKTEEYKNYAVLERVYMGDTVTIKHSKLDINLKAKVIKTTKNVLTNRIEKIELGSFKENIATSINKSIQEVKKEIAQVTSAYQIAIDNATNLITGSNGGNVVIHQNDSGLPDKIFIMDTTDVMTAMNVWCWSIGGFGYSSTGVNGPYDTAITMDGSIVGKFITALEINGEQITGGIIKGIRIQQVNGDIVLADLYKDVNGGALYLNDINGNINVVMGSEFGTSNVGGTLILFDDSVDKPRASMAITSNTHAGYIQFLDNSRRIRTAIVADNVGNSGPLMYCADTSGVIKSWVTDKGFFGVGRKCRTSWYGTIAADSSVYISHNLGYYPIIQLDGRVGNVVVTTANTDTLTTRIYAFTNSWTGTIRFY